MVRLAIVLAPLLFALFVYSVITVLMTREEDCRHLPKWGWLLVVLLFPFIGSVLWIGVGRHRTPRPRAYERSAPAFPEYDRLGRQAATNPEADDAFLKQVRERAEAQRRNEREARLQRQREIEQSDIKPAKDPDKP